MTDSEAESKMLEVLRKETIPIKPDLLYEKMETLGIDEAQARRAAVSLAVDHRVEITPSRLIQHSGKVPKKPKKGAGSALTENEKRLWEKLAISGLPLKEAALALQMNYWTALHYVKLLHRKLNVSSRGALVAAWYQRVHVR